MDDLVKEYLSTQRVCSLTTLKRDGSPHAAIMHYSESLDPLYVYFSADQNQIKVESLFDGRENLSSVAIGFSEDEWLSLQMDGTIRMITDEDQIKEIKKDPLQKDSDFSSL